MRHYETIFIINPELTEEDTTGVIEKFSGILTDSGAVMAKVENWGRKRLAYTVKKFNKGYYVLFNYGAGPEAVTEMERNFKIDEQVIRYLTVKLGEAFDPSQVVEDKPAEEPEQDEVDSAEAAPAEEQAGQAEEAEPEVEEPKAEEASPETKE